VVDGPNQGEKPSGISQRLWNRLSCEPRCVTTSRVSEHQARKLFGTGVSFSGKKYAREYADKLVDNGRSALILHNKSRWIVFAGRTDNG
jgi:hypothetical protein